jgi:hypothetical protein
VSEIFQGLDDGEQLLFGDGVPLLDVHQFFAEKSKGFTMLADDAPYLFAAGVGVHNEWLCKVRVS